MSQSPKVNEARITTEALRELGNWNDIFRSETRSRACRMAVESGVDPLVSPEILREAIVAACTEIVERIRFESGGERKNDTRAA